MLSAETMMLKIWATASERMSALRAELDECCRRIDDMRDLTGVNYDGMPHGSTVGNPTERKALAAIALGESYADLMDFTTSEIRRTISIMKTVDCVLGCMDPTVRTICVLRYSRNYSWWKVAHELNISEDYAKHLHTAVLKALKNSTPNNTF